MYLFIRKNFEVLKISANISVSYKKIPAYRRRGHLLTACNAAQPTKSKMANRGLKMADGVYKGVYP